LRALLMLLILVPAAWLVVVALLVALCQSAARGEAALSPAVDDGAPVLVRPGLKVWDRSAALALRTSAGEATARSRSRRVYTARNVLRRRGAAADGYR
jgi:hypothetical protein